MNTNGAATEFIAIENDVISLGAETCVTLALVLELSGGAGNKLGFIFRDGAREGMVNGVPLTFFFIITKKREFGNP